jgi:hypothetical protein
MKFCKTAAMKIIQEINAVKELMYREIMEADETEESALQGQDDGRKKQEVAAASCTYSQSDFFI